VTPVHSARGSRAQTQNAAEIYEQLRDLNQHCTAAIDILAVFNRKELVPDIECTYHCAMLEEFRASISQNLTEYMNGYEISAAAKADRKRLKLERKLFEPDS
jgi:hypothetical protein